MRQLFSTPRTWAVSLSIIIACGVDARAPGLLPEEEEADDEAPLDLTAGTGGAPGRGNPTQSPPAGEGPSDPYLDAAGASGISSAGAGGLAAGGAAGGAMNVGGAAGSAMNVGGAAGSVNAGGAAGSVNAGGAAGSAM